MKLTAILGQVVKADGMSGAMLNEMVFVGKKRITGELIRLDCDMATILCYEDVSFLKVGDPVERSAKFMCAELGPGLIGSIFDGLQRPLKKFGTFMDTQGDCPSLDTDVKWSVYNSKSGKVAKGETIAEVKESKAIVHKVLAPCDGEAKIKDGEYSVNEVIGCVVCDGSKVDVKLLTTWSVKIPRAYREKHVPSTMLVSGQRVLDTLFPIAKGGAGAIPGGFGTGKTVTTQSIAKFCDADIIVMTLVGERGNECADVLKSFAELVDPKSGNSIMEKSVIIANTSNMPVSARIASMYLGVTIGEYYRDMGYNVLMIADSTSRWAEALREVSGCLEEMPGEEGFPVYLASYVAAFYGRAGYVDTLGCGSGSLTILGAVSPPGGDFSEPMVQATKSVVRSLWSLNPELAYSRHYPAVDWFQSYSNYDLDGCDKVMDDMRETVKKLLEREEEILSAVRLVGYESLSSEEKFVLYFADLFKKDFMQQSAMHKVDRYTSFMKQRNMLEAFLTYFESGLISIRNGDDLKDVVDKSISEKLSKMKFSEQEEFGDVAAEIEKSLLHEKEFVDYEELSERLEEEDK